MKKIELLAPAGNMECLEAAINNGADAVYIGGKNFSARAYADNFDDTTIVEAINYAHIKGAKVYVAINTLVYDEEIENVIDYVDFLYVNNVDALIVGDYGLLCAIKQRYPQLRVHVSTQLNTHNLWQVKNFEALHVDRIILARETSMSTIKYIKENSDVELEVFAHGALCVCYSGNCLHSSMIGKRSGNRGKCAQPCRMEYTLLENHKPVSTKKYLLSMKDLNTLEHIDELIKSGISSLKIEGRMKSKEYVALVTKTYRDAIDNYYETFDNKVDYLAIDKMQLVFSRGFTKGYIFNEENKELTNTYRPSHLGTKIGKVVSTKNDRVQIKLSTDIFQKDKICIVQERYDDIGIYLSKIYVKDRLVSQGYKDETIEICLNSKVEKDALVYKVVDNALVEEINETYLKEVKRVGIRMKFISNVGEQLVLTVKDNNNHSVIVKSDYVVEKAINSPTTNEKISEQLSKLNNTAYYITNLNVLTDGEGIIPVKYINDLRREAIAKMDQARIKVYNRSIEDANENIEYIKAKQDRRQKLKVKVHNMYQLEAISSLEGIDSIYYDDIATFNIVKEKYPSLNIIPVLPRIMNDKSPIKINSKKYVVSNHGDILKYEGYRLITDLYLNVTNKLTLANLCKENVESITISSELNHNQISQLIKDFNQDYGFIPPLEMVVYGHYQTMITKYCFIAKEHGFNRKHCNSCKNKIVELQDRMNYIFPVTTDSDCNVTIYNSRALHLIKYVNEIFDSGISSIRLDFSIENPQDTYTITKAYLDMINYGDDSLSLQEATYGYYLDLQSN